MCSSDLITQDSLIGRLRVERIPAIDQGEKKAAAMRLLQKRMSEKGAACAEIRTGELRNGAFRQAASDRVIDRGHASR